MYIVVDAFTVYLFSKILSKEKKTIVGIRSEILQSTSYDFIYLKLRLNSVRNDCEKQRIKIRKQQGQVYRTSDCHSEWNPR